MLYSYIMLSIVSSHFYFHEVKKVGHIISISYFFFVDLKFKTLTTQQLLFLATVAS